MIVHRDLGWIYVGVPKTASTTLHAFLAARGGAARGRQHAMAIPPELRGYRVLATSMNPYRRAWSLWRMLGSDAAKGARFTWRVPTEVLRSFPAFVDRVLRGGVRTIALYRWPVHRWLEELPDGVDPVVVPVERLDAGLRELGLLGPHERVPVRNATRGGDWLAAYDEGVAAVVRAWAAEDFRRSGYARELATWRRRERVRRLGVRAGHVARQARRGLRALSGRSAEAGR